VKVGDLVKWTHPHSKDIGVILDADSDKWGGQVIIHWFGNPDHSGLYPIDHELLELISESR